VNKLKYTWSKDQLSLFSNKFNPQFITGFCDAESCFSLNILKNPLYSLGWKISLVFSIHLHSKDVDILYLIQKFFGVGNVTLHGNSAMYQVTKLGDLLIIIDHFNLYPLLTKKYADFLLFKKAFDIIKDKKHLTIEGLHDLISIRASLNKGLIERLKLVGAANPNIKPAVRPEIPNLSKKHNNSDINHWIAGFVSGEGCFFIQTRKSKTHKLGISIALNFCVVQNIRDSYLLASFSQIFGCGSINIVEKSGIVSFSVRNYSDITNKIIPFFEEYNIQGVKAKDFNDFKEVSILMKSKLHLTKEGLDKILLIKSRMNFNRVGPWTKYIFTKSKELYLNFLCL
jgi:hypothetical protein